MGTKKAKTSKTTAAKKATANKNANRSIKAVAGQAESFYKGFPRGAAYALLEKAPKRTMKVPAFLAKVQKLKNVGTAARANGILQKLVDPKCHSGIVPAHFVS